MFHRVTLLFLLAPLALGRADESGQPRALAFAVIVNPKNPVDKISFSELRAYLKMTRQFWPNKKRCDLYLPKHTTPGYRMLLKTVYKMSHRKLQKYWVRKLFSGDIPAKPSSVPSVKAAGSLIRKHVGALTIVRADKVPKGVKVLLVDGKKPGEAGYKLVAKTKPKA